MIAQPTWKQLIIQMIHTRLGKATSAQTQQSWFNTKSENERMTNNKRGKFGGHENLNLRGNLPASMYYNYRQKLKTFEKTSQRQSATILVSTQTSFRSIKHIDEKQCMQKTCKRWNLKTAFEKRHLSVTNWNGRPTNACASRFLNKKCLHNFSLKSVFTALQKNCFAQIRTTPLARLAVICKETSMMLAHIPQVFTGTFIKTSTGLPYVN